MVDFKKKPKHGKRKLYFQAAQVRLFDYVLCDVDKKDQIDYESIAKRASGKNCVKKIFFHDKLLYMN